MVQWKSHSRTTPVLSGHFFWTCILESYCREGWNAIDIPLWCAIYLRKKPGGLLLAPHHHHHHSLSQYQAIISTTPHIPDHGDSYKKNTHHKSYIFLLAQWFVWCFKSTRTTWCTKTKMRKLKGCIRKISY